MIITAVVFLAALILWIIRYLSPGQRRQRDLLSKIPRPYGRLPIFGHLFLLYDPVKDGPTKAFELFSQLARKHEDEGMFRFEMLDKTYVQIYSAEATRALLSSNVHTRKGDLFKVGYDWFGLGLPISEGAMYDHDRKLLTPAFHNRVLHQFLPIFAKHGLKFVAIVKRQNFVLDNVKEATGHLLLDALFETNFGEVSNLQETGSNAYAKAFDVITTSLVKRGCNPLVRDARMFALTPTGKKFFEAVKYTHDYDEKLIKKRQAERANQATDERHINLLDIMLDIHEEDPHKLSLLRIREQTDSFLFAGHDTTSTAIANTLLELAANPDIQDRLRDELVAIIEDRLCPKIEEINECKYLDMVLKESMRKWPPALTLHRKIIDEELALTEKITVPKGVDVLVNVYALHHNRNYYPDPDRFDPDRFLTANVLARPNFTYVPMSAGKRSCIGQDYGWLSMKVTLAVILLHLKVIPITRPEEVIQHYGVPGTLEPIRLKFLPNDFN